MRFGNKDVAIPLRAKHAWLDWDIAFAITNHDFEIKQTYINILSGPNRPELFVDIGANYGTHSILFLVHGIKVISFEPIASCNSYFHELCKLNMVTKNMEQVALGNYQGNVILKYAAHATWVGSVDSDTQKQIGRDCELVEEEVPMKRLDDYFEQLKGRQMLIKIDTEGNEISVIRGAKKTLDSCKPLIIFECHRSGPRQDLMAEFLMANYEIYNLPWQPIADYRQVPLVGREFVEASQTNFMAVPAGFFVSKL